MRTCYLTLAFAWSLAAPTSASWSGRGASPALMRTPSFVLSVRGGANEYEAKFESIKSSVLEKAYKKVCLVACRGIDVTRRDATLLVDNSQFHRNVIISISSPPSRANSTRSKMPAEKSLTRGP